MDACSRSDSSGRSNVDAWRERVPLSSSFFLVGSSAESRGQHSTLGAVQSRFCSASSPEQERIAHSFSGWTLDPSVSRFEHRERGFSP